MAPSKSEPESLNSTSLIPLIRSRVDFEMVKLEGRLNGVQESAAIPIVFRPFGQELGVALVEDTDSEWTAIAPSVLSSMEMSFDEALNFAMNRFTSINTESEQSPFEQLESGYWEADDCQLGEASSQVLFPQIINELEVKGKPVAFIPDGSTLWIVDSANPRLLARVADAALRAFESAKESSVTPVPFALDEKRWLAYHVDERHPAFATLAKARLLRNRLNYETQQAVLNAHATTDAPMAVEFQVDSTPAGKGRGAAHSYSIAEWNDGDAVLLPRTDYVRLQSNHLSPAPGSGSQTGDIVLKWATLSKTLGDRMQAQDLFPERYLVRQFFSASELRQLLPHQVDFAAIQAASSANIHDSVPDDFKGAGAGAAIPTHAPQKSNATWWILGCATTTIVGLLLLLAAGIAMIYAFRPSSSDDSQANAPRPRSEFRNRNPTIDRIRSPQISIPSFSPSNQAETIPPPDPKKFDDCDIELPRLDIEEKGLTKQQYGDPNSGTSFVSHAPEGGMLVGFQFGLNDSWSGSICGLRPIYQVGKSYENDSWFGSGSLTGSAEAIARPGYAVSGIKIRRGLAINSMQIEFKKVTEEGRLDPRDKYVSEWIGGGGGGMLVLNAGRNPVVGLSGSYADELESIGWVTGFTLPAPEDSIALYEPTSRNDLSTLGEPEFTRFEDNAPEGGVLVGLRVFKGERWGGVMQSLQPIYQVDDKYVLGDVLGPGGGEPVELLARPGFAVGAIHVKKGLVLNCIQLVFYRYEEGKLIPGDDNRSSWCGVNTGSERSVDSREKPIVGLMLSAQVDIHSITPIAGAD